MSTASTLASTGFGAPAPGGRSIGLTRAKQRKSAIGDGDSRRSRETSAPAPVSAPITDEDKLHQIIMEQSSSGAFPWNVALARHLKIVGADADKLQLPEGFSNVSNIGEVWMTILVCVFLESKLAHEKDVWELVVEKAWAFVTNSVDAEKVSQLRKAAEAAIAV